VCVCVCVGVCVRVYVCVRVGAYMHSCTHARVSMRTHVGTRAVLTAIAPEGLQLSRVEAERIK